MFSQKKYIQFIPYFVITCSSLFSHADTGDISFTPTGLKFPIVSIALVKNNGSVGTAINLTKSQTLYQCSGATESDCLIDLASQADLDKISNAAQDVKVENGIYDGVTLTSCIGAKSGSDTVSIWLKGSFTTGGQTYYTDPTASNLNGVTTAGSSADFTEITNWGCSTKLVLLPTPIQIGPADTSATPTPVPTTPPSSALGLTLTVLVDNTFLANSKASTSPGEGGCKAQTGGHRGVCVNIPALLPYVGTDTVTTKRFLVAHSGTSSVVDAKANAIVIVPLAGTTPLTAFAGPYFTETSAAGNGNTSNTNTTDGGPSYNTSTDLSTFKVHNDGTIEFKQGGSLDNNAAAFTNFTLGTHSGTMTTRDGLTNWYYHAVMLP